VLNYASKTVARINDALPELDARLGDVCRLMVIGCDGAFLLMGIMT